MIIFEVAMLKLTNAPGRYMRMNSFDIAKNGVSLPGNSLKNMLRKIATFYAGALRSSVASPTGRRLWLLLILKITILLVVFKILFFPNRLNSEYATDAERAEAVRHSLIQK